MPKAKKSRKNKGRPAKTPNQVLAEAKDKRKKNLKEKLQAIYNSVDMKTVGCAIAICKCACCKVAMPQMNYSEFVQLATELWKNSSNVKKKDIICTSIEYFFRNEYEKWGMESLIKPCQFVDEAGRCGVYENRPLSCFLPDTLLYTEEGPKYIRDVMAGDMVYGKDGMLHKVLCSFSRIHTGLIYAIHQKGCHTKSWCTGDHRWLTVRQRERREGKLEEWVESKDMIPKKHHKEGDFLLTPKLIPSSSAFWTHLDTEKFVGGRIFGERIVPVTSGKLFEGKKMQSIPQKIELCDEFLFMLGIYLAEGSASESSVTFTMHKKELPHLQRIERYLNSLNIRTHYNKLKKGKNVVVLRVDSCLFSRLMKKIGGFLSHGKKIHVDLFKNVSSCSKLKILEGWNVGDGRKDSRHIYSISTVSKDLVFQMSQVLLEQGMVPRVYDVKNAKRDRQARDLIVYDGCEDGFNRKPNSRHIVQKHMIGMSCDDIETMDYEGPVYDLQVQDSESFVTVNGIVHNCRAYGLWPQEEYEKRVDKFEEAYKKHGLTRDDLPLAKQCKMIKRADGSTELTMDELNDLFEKLDQLDKSIGSFSNLQIKSKENYRTFHDWLLLKVFGEDWLSMLTTFMMSADKEQMIDQVAQLRKVVDVTLDIDDGKIEDRF